MLLLLASLRFLLLLELRLLEEHHALHDAAEVALVEEVVRLGGSGLELLADLKVDFGGCLDTELVGLVQRAGDLRPSEVPVHEFAEDPDELRLVALDAALDVEVAQESAADCVSASAWWAHSPNEHCINDFHPFAVGTTVPPASV